MTDDFPWRELSKEFLIAEYDRLKKKLEGGVIFPIPFIITGFKCSDAYFQYERMNTAGIGRPSSIDYWKKNKDKIIIFSKKMKHSLFIIVNYFNHAPSHFPLVTAGRIYKYFKATNVLDPYAGWGDRCLAAMALNINYTGIEKNKKLKIPFKNLVKTYHTKSKVKMIFNSCEKVNLDRIDFDFVLTSPPFWKRGEMIERYEGIEVDYNSFLKTSLVPVMERCLQRGVWVCLYIPKSMYDDLVKIFGECKEELTCKFNHFHSSSIYCWKN